MIDIYLTLLMLFTLVYFSKIEFLSILNSDNYLIKVSNANIHAASAKKILNGIENNRFLSGVFNVFRYQILFILFLIVFYINSIINGIDNLYTDLIVIITISILLFTIIVPLKYIYMKSIKKSLILNISIDKYFENGFRYLSKEEKININLDNSLAILNERNIETYSDYLILINSLNIDKLEALSETDYNKYILYFDKYNLIVRFNNRLSVIYIHDNSIELYNAGIYPNSMFKGMFAEEMLLSKINERSLDAIILFPILHLVTYWR